MNKSDMVIFDITLGTSIRGNQVNWGCDFFRNQYYNPFGSLHEVQNKIGINRNEAFFLSHLEKEGFAFFWRSYSYSNELSYRRLCEIFRDKELYITVDEKNYTLGKSIFELTEENYLCHGIYMGDSIQNELKNLAFIMKQTGKTKRFYCNWY